MYYRRYRNFCMIWVEEEGGRRKEEGRKRKDITLI
jgi:hypothetical protein